MNRLIYLKMKLVVSFSMTCYQTDFSIHDVEFMEDNPEAEFIWVVRKSGTHIFRIWKNQDLPPNGVKVPYLFSEATREHIVTDELNALQNSCTPHNHDFYLIDPQNGTFRKITQKEAIEILSRNIENLNNSWKQEAV